MVKRLAGMCTESEAEELVNMLPAEVHLIQQTYEHIVDLEHRTVLDRKFESGKAVHL